MTSRGSRRAARGLIAVGIALVVTGCDLEVTSPAFVEEANLDDPRASLALLRGAEGDFAHVASGQAGFGGAYMAGALMTDELVHSGLRQGLRGFSDGRMSDAWQEVTELWRHGSQARFTTEQAVVRLGRMIEGLPPDSVELAGTITARLAAANLWAGFANRLMGDTFCHAVIDGGPQQDHTEYYRRAEPYFTRAIEMYLEGAVGSDEATAAGLAAAHAGRAQVRVMLGNWTGALQDAAIWQEYGVFTHTHTSGAGRERAWNFFNVAVLPENREVTLWGTPFQEWGRRVGVTPLTGDPRVKYNVVTATPLGTDGVRPFLRQNKHNLYSGAMPAAGWNEMRLIEAEAALRDGDIEEMVRKLNVVRADHNRRNPGTSTAAQAERIALLDTTVQRTEAEAWELYMKERGIVLYLEGRRLPDMRRWMAQPGSVPFEVIRESDAAKLNVLDVDHDMCIPVSAEERRTNPNL